jgi:secreted Zn-dependent insulinase-like peptidase
VGTQGDKLGDALQALLELMNDMPEDERMFNGAREAVQRKIESNRTTKENIYWSWENARRLGLGHDLQRDVYAALPALDLPAMRRFFDEQVKGRHFTYMVIGKVEDMDRKALEKLGPVEQLEVEFLFGYDRDGDPR